MSTITFTVTNISCGHCVQTIRNELSELEGVTRVEPSQETKQVVVEFGPPATEARIAALLTEINYPPTG
ncbi:MAG: heavy-metal-associated domain-containing protein [Anaerolineales bacterium]|jgi:copper chaperone CopZ